MNVTGHEISLEALDGLSDVDTLCLFVGEEDRPLPGTAGFVDWRLCGALSRVLQAGFFKGELDEQLLLPSKGGLPMPRIFVVGTGKGHQGGGDWLSYTLTAAARMLTRAKCGNVALELPGAGTAEDSVRASALSKHFLPEFKGERVAVLGEKPLLKLLG